MQIRRPLAALMTALALFGGGATLTGCGDPAGADRNDGTTDVGGSDDTDRGNLPNNSDPEHGSEDSNDDTQDPD
jgi:hypothetical protein